MKKNKSNINIISFLLFAALSAGSAKGDTPIIIEYKPDFAAAAKVNARAQEILNEINAQEKIFTQNNASTMINNGANTKEKLFTNDNSAVILDKSMNDVARTQLPLLKYGAPVQEIKYEVVKPQILKYAPPIMSLYAVPSPTINPIEKIR